MNDLSMLREDDDRAMAELFEEMQFKAEQVAKRIETGTATVDDAIWIRAEYGLTSNRKEL